MVAIIPGRLRVPVAVLAGLAGIVVLFSSCTRWQSGPFYGTHFDAVRGFAGLLVLWFASHVYRHQDD